MLSQIHECLLLHCSKCPYARLQYILDDLRRCICVCVCARARARLLACYGWLNNCKLMWERFGSTTSMPVMSIRLHKIVRHFGTFMRTGSVSHSYMTCHCCGTQHFVPGIRFRISSCTWLIVECDWARSHRPNTTNLKKFAYFWPDLDINKLPTNGPLK